jgi:ABC-type Na+ transport system ATPase subunit NatA
VKLAKLNDFRRKLGNSHPLNGITKITTPQGEELQTFLVSSVCGLNGSGKTRLLREIAQDLSPVTFDGVTITKTDANPTYINPSILVSYT